MLRRIKTLGLLLGRGFGKTLAKAIKARESGGSDAAIAVLDEALGWIQDDDELRAHSDYAAARVLYAECQAERGVRTGKLADVLAGVRVLLRADKQYRACLMGDTEAWPSVLAKADGFLQAVLDPAWQPGSDKESVRSELGQLAAAYNALPRAADAVRVAESGLRVFPGDADLQLGLAEAALGQGDLRLCFQHALSALAGGGLPGSPAKVLMLLEMVGKSADRTLAGRSAAWAGEVYRRLNRWDQAQEMLLRAQGMLGDDLGDAAVEALLVACARKRAFRELEQHGRHHIERGLAAEHLAPVALAIRELLESFAERPQLWLLWAEASLVLGRPDDALCGFQRALALDRGMAADTLAALRTLGSAEAIPSGLRVALARAFLGGGEVGLGLDLLRHLGQGNVLPEELTAASRLCRELLEREPGHAAATECLLDLQTAQQDWTGAADTGRRWWQQSGDTEWALALSDRLATAAAAGGDPAGEMAARQLEIDVRWERGEPKAVLAGVRRLADHPAATPEVLAWAAERLAAFNGSPELGAAARWVKGDIHRRQGQPRQAAEEYLAVLESRPAPDLLEGACTGLSRVWTGAADRDRARVALARGWLSAGRPGEARTPLLECLEARHAESTTLLELLRTRQAQNPGSDQWVTLGIEAGLAIGVESNLAAVAESLYRLLELRPERAAWIEETARHLAARAAADETREAALLVQARAAVVCGNGEGVERICQWLAETQPPWRLSVVEAITEAAAAVEPAVRARLYMALGRMLALCPGDESRAARCFEQATGLDPQAWGEVAIGEVSRLAVRPNADPGLALAVARAAHRLGRGESACGELLHLLERLREAQVTEARELSRQVVREHPESPRALLLLARCEARLGQRPAAVAAYRRLIALRDASLHEITLGDLSALQQAHGEDYTVFDAWLDALEAHDSGAEVRQALLQRLVRFPAQAASCLDRLRLRQQGHPGNWDEAFALAEGLRVAGRVPEALEVWNATLRLETVDWEAAAAALRQVAVMRSRDFVAAALLLRAELRSLPPDGLVEALQRMERVLVFPGRDEPLLASLLEDCSQAERRAGGEDQVARLALIRRAEVLTLLGQGAAAAAELERLLRDWPAEARNVAAFCQRELDAGREPVHWRPLARARFVAGDCAGGVAALQRLVEALPEQAAEARAVCLEFAQRAEGREAELALLLGADLAARSGDFGRAAQDYLALARRVPVSVADVTARLAGLVEHGATAPEVYAALAELELGGQVERLVRAFGVLRRFVEADLPGRVGSMLALVRGWKAQFPQCLEPRLQLLWMLFRKSPFPEAELESEARSLLADFGAEGARALVTFCGEELTMQRAHASFWHVRCAAHDRLGDLAGSLACLRTLLKIDFLGEAAAVERHALSLRREGAPSGGVLELLADLGRQEGDWPKAAAYAAEAVEAPDVDLAGVRAGILAILEADPTNATALGALARCEWRAGNGVAAAMHLRRASALSATPGFAERVRALCEAFPTVAACWFVRGEWAYRRQDYGEALAALNQAAALPGLEPAAQLQSWRMLAECHVVAHHYDQAAAFVRRMIEANPADDQAARRLMELHFEKTAHELAQARDAIRTGGETPDLAFRLGCLLQAQGDYDEAARWFRKVPREHALANRALIESGRCRLALNQGHLATAAFKAALTNGPTGEDRCAALYHLGTAYSRLLDFERASQAFEELCVLNPDYEDAGRQLQLCQEQLATGEKMRMAEVPFDLLTAWRDATAKPRPDTRPPRAASGPVLPAPPAYVPSTAGAQSPHE